MYMKTLLTCGVAVLLQACIAGIAYAQSDIDAERAGLGLITETADRICGYVSSDGSSSSTDIQGSINGELKGLATRLAKAGINGSAKIVESHYTGVIQTELSGVLKSSSECKERIFNSLRDIIFKSSSAPADTQKSETITGPNVNFGCESNNSSSATYTAAPGLRILNVVISLFDANNTKSSSARIISNDGTTVNAVADFRGLDKEWTGNCPGGGHGALRMVVTTVGK